MCTILSSDSDREEVKAQQSIIKRYLGSHLLDPTKELSSLKVYDVWNFSRLKKRAGLFHRLSTSDKEYDKLEVSHNRYLAACLHPL